MHPLSFWIRSVLSPVESIENLLANAPPREYAYNLVVCPTESDQPKSFKRPTDAYKGCEFR